ncbi:hypothetical protein EJ07DRAFT_183923 [Lizonia empirigonia]|nr:hypothetical protein EJ07DRAFT_183923 [Lizonia empirigonia]
MTRKKLDGTLYRTKDPDDQLGQQYTTSTRPRSTSYRMKRNIVIFLIILILFILIALIAYLIYYLQTRMAVGGTATSSGSDMTSVA